MNRRIRKQSAAEKSDNGYLRYLRPGALAQLRDSKINARSLLRSCNSQIYLHRAIPSSPSRSSEAVGSIQQQQQEVTGTFTTTDGELPFLSGRSYAPRCPQRKRLTAARSVFYLNHNSTSLTSDGPEPAIDVFSTDFLVAH
ncbi:unnamed protein product [Lactuca saligna]|uniref:Uncharacterized protein n=1 Tax=Lactuca saligna TaxID=75948 RepID=A0AA35URX0_LACSI|nr:unnamed protein product [Lactuca saligna]